MASVKTTFDFPGILDYVTGLNKWEEMQGQDSNNGLDYYYKTKDESHEAYINLDQNCMTVEVDGEVMYSGDYTDDESLAKFIKTETTT